MFQPKLVLASASPRRLDLLAQIGIRPDLVSAAYLDETPKNGELPACYARRIVIAKAEALAAQHDGVVLAGDTVVACGRRILPKAKHLTPPIHVCDCYQVVNIVCMVALR